jgi:folate-binding protein YgfZ
MVRRRFRGEVSMTSVSIEQQVAWARSSALVVTAEERCVLAVTGAERLSWLNGLLTCDLSLRKVGEAVQGLAVAQKGKILTDVVVVVEEARALLVVQRATADALVVSFEHHLMMEDAELSRAASHVAFVHGPRAGEVLDAVRRAGGAGGSFDVTGSGGAILVTDAESPGERALLQGATDAGGGAGDDSGWEVVRVLAAVPRFGVDFDDGTYPQEAALETKAVSFEKGCYLGQEVVCMLEMRGHVKKKLVSLAVEGGEVPRAHAPVVDANGASIGEVTSAVHGADGSVRALAMVKYAFIASGTAVVVEGHAARVV